MPKNPATAWTIFIFCSIVWGSSFILMKQALQVFSPLELGFLRVSIAGLCLLPVALHSLGRLKAKGTQVPFGKLLFATYTGSILPAFIFALAISHLQSATTGILNSTTGVMTFTLGVLFFGIPFRWVKLLGVVLGLAGAVSLILLKPGAVAGSPAGPDDVIWGLLVLVATIMYGFNVNYVKRHLTHLPAQAVVSLGMSLGGIPLALGLFAFTPFVHTVQTHPDAWQALGFVLLLAAVGTALTVVLFYELLRLAGTLLASSVTYCIPAVALLWGVAFGEPVGWVHAVAFAGILCGVWLVSRPEAKPQPLTK